MDALHVNRPRLCGFITVLTVIGFSPGLLAWTPGTGNPGAVQDFTVDPLNRRDVLSFYNCVHAASENYRTRMEWTGSVAAGTAGTTGAVFREDVRRRLNFYRALTGLPADIVFDPVKNGKAQQAALMMSRNNTLSHSPPESWEAWTPEGAAAAGASNLALGNFGPGAIDAYLTDDGANNLLVGHRRWILYSKAQSMGTGDIPGEGDYAAANALWVLGDSKTAAAGRFTAWPNEGFSPFPLMPERWSLSHPEADFAQAAVSMTIDGVSVDTAVVSRADKGYGDNTIVWEPRGLPASIAGDTVCTVTVSGIGGQGMPAAHTYTVKLFDPAVLGESMTISGTDTPPAAPAGAVYTFNSIEQADAYELRVSSGSSAPWTEGAEDIPAPRITPRTTGSYPLRQTAVKRTGTQAFHLAFPDFSDQNFEVTREVRVSASSQLQWYDLGRFGTPESTLSAEVSTDSGNTWTSLFSRPGTGLNSTSWDAAFISRSVSLGALAGEMVRVRFILRGNGAGIVRSVSENDGFFIDDITITDAVELVGTTTTTLPGTATSFTLNAGTAGAPLTGGASYFLRIRPNVGTRWFGDSALKTVTAETPAGSGYAAWVTAQYPEVTEGPDGDHDHDGIPNGVEYGFGLNPAVPDASPAIPEPVLTLEALTVTYTAPATVTGVTYGAQWTADFVTWNEITDTGTGGAHTFSVPAAGRDRLFFRHRLEIAP
ncbi:MAG: CAP domain-containing protein [Verrucomicrobiota bacterium]